MRGAALFRANGRADSGRMADAGRIMPDSGRMHPAPSPRPHGFARRFRDRKQAETFQPQPAPLLCRHFRRQNIPIQS